MSYSSALLAVSADNPTAHVRLSPQNEILSKLPSRELDAIMAAATEISCDDRSDLFRQGDLVDKVYFPLTGMVSLVIVLENGTTVEAMTVGREGFTGVPLINGVHTARYKGICQVAGDFLVLERGAFLSIVQNLPDLKRRLQRYSQFASEVVAQSAACNGTHNIEQRCARWLLITSDAVGRKSFNITQEFLAQMLAVRRPGVSVAMGGLAKRELVSYRHGKVILLDRDGLKTVACECYRTIRRKAEELLD